MWKPQDISFIPDDPQVVWITHSEVEYVILWGMVGYNLRHFSNIFPLESYRSLLQMEGRFVQLAPTQDLSINVFLSLPIALSDSTQ